MKEKNLFQESEEKQKPTIAHDNLKLKLIVVLRSMRAEKSISITFVETKTFITIMNAA